MANARPYPPSAQRVAAARASGHLPRPTLAATSSAYVLIAASVALFGSSVLNELAQLLRTTIEAVARGDSGVALGALIAWLRRASLLAALALSLLTTAIAIAVALARGSFGASRRGTLRFPKLRESRAAAGLWSLAIALTSGLALADVWLLGFDDLPALARRWAGSLALFAVGCALVDVAFARARFYRSLWMTRAELRDEQRAAFGAPEVREARRRSRAEFNATGPV